MEITAKFKSRCRKCGQTIWPGDQIIWERGQGSEHVECPAPAGGSIPDEPAPAKSAPAEPDPNEIRISKGSGYGGRPYSEGQVLRNPKNNEQIIIVLEANQQYYREDGMSFGVGDESGYIYWARCRPATDEEAAPLLEREAKATARKKAQAALEQVAQQIEGEGERPDVPDGKWPEGEEILVDPRTEHKALYGGGSRLILAEDYIWYILGNGADGDNWSHNNVRSGIAWRVAATDELIAKIKEANARRGLETMKEAEARKAKAEQERLAAQAEEWTLEVTKSRRATWNQKVKEGDVRTWKQGQALEKQVGFKLATLKEMIKYHGL